MESNQFIPLIPTPGFYINQIWLHLPSHNPSYSRWPSLCGFTGCPFHWMWFGHHGTQTAIAASHATLIQRKPFAIGLLGHWITFILKEIFDSHCTNWAYLLGQTTQKKERRTRQSWHHHNSQVSGDIFYPQISTIWKLQLQVCFVNCSLYYYQQFLGLVQYGCLKCQL